MAINFEDSDNDPIIQKIYNHAINTFSGGELRYLEIFTLFKLDRKYYMLDEPFTGIEPKIIEKIIVKLQSEKSTGKGILLTDHYQHYVSEVLDDAYLLENGQCKLI